MCERLFDPGAKFGIAVLQLPLPPCRSESLVQEGYGLPYEPAEDEERPDPLEEDE